MTFAIETLTKAAAALGLHLEVPKARWWNNIDCVVLDGTIDGVRVVFEQSIGQYTSVFITAMIDPPLDLGVSIARAGFYLLADTLKGRHDIQVGDPALDQALRVYGVEPERIMQLFTPAFQEQMRSWERERATQLGGDGNWFDYWIYDDCVVLWCYAGTRKWGLHPELPYQEILRFVRATIDLAQATQRAAASVAPSKLLAPHVPAWRAFADAHGLAFTESPLRLQGTLDGAAFLARPTFLLASGDTYAVDLSIRFKQPFPSYVRVTPKGLSYPTAPAGEADHAAWHEAVVRRSTEDKAFNKSFWVYGSDPDFVTRILDADVRAALLALEKNHGDVFLRYDEVSVRSRALLPPDRFHELLDPLVKLEGLLTARASR